ncbi:MAG: HD-GYP domain-containing protein [Pirellulales bacterium]|nr:HD-GYP domain-containing protein [Pirellulales bacterium]
MLRVPLHKLQPGMILARAIAAPGDPRMYLVQRDREVPADLIPRLRDLGITDVWVRFRDLEFLEGLIDEGLGEHQREVYQHVRRNFEQMLGGAAFELDYNKFTTSIGDLFQYLKQNPCGNVLLQKLESYDNYLMSHSTNVCYLALLLGLKLEKYLIEERSFKTAREAKDIQLLGLGCILHDVGKMRIPAEILNKPSRLTEEEMRIMEMHTIYGYEMVKGQVPASAAQIVLNHHQRFNGKGYPVRVDPTNGQELPPLVAKQIPIFSRITTIVDVYDAATAKRVYSAAKPSVRVLHEMKTWCQGFFDPRIEKAFFEIIPPFPVGSLVKLNNGIEGAVIDFNPQHPTRPKIQGLIDPYGQPFENPANEELDLALHPDLHVAMADDQDVTPYLATQETLENQLEYAEAV